MRDGLKNLGAETVYNLKLKQLLSEKWSSAISFYVENHQYRIPTQLSADLGRIGIQVDNKRTESEILSTFDPHECLPKNIDPAQKDQKKKPLPMVLTSLKSASEKPPKIVSVQAPKTGYFPENPALSRLLGVVGGSSSQQSKPRGMSKLGGLDELFAGKSGAPITPPTASNPDSLPLMEPPVPPKPTQPVSRKPEPIEPPEPPKLMQEPAHPEPDPPEPSPEPAPESSRTGSLEGTNPVFSLDIKGPEDINKSSAEIILTGIGLIGPKSVHKLNYQEALEALHRGKTYERKPGVKLDSVTKIKYGPEKSMRQMIFEEYERLKEAIRKYPDQSLISKKNDPDQFREWVENSAKALTNLEPVADRQRLMLSLMSRESGQTHWRDYVPITSTAAAVGFGQFLPRTAEGYKINPYDPEQNIKGIAIMINEHLRTKSLKDALIFYNAGGTKPTPQAAIDYANAIIKNMKNY